MNENLEALVTEAVREGTNQSWWLTLATLIIAAVACVVGFFIFSYAKKKGEHLATKEDYDELLQQVRRSTEATEDIKARISRRSNFEERLLMDRYVLVSGLENRLERAATQIYRVHAGFPPEGFVLGDGVFESPELTSVAEEVNANAYLCGPQFADLFGRQMNVLVEVMNVKDDDARLEKIREKFRASRQEFHDLMRENFGVKHITWKPEGSG